MRFGSTSGKLNSAEGSHILKVFLWTIASAAVAGLLSLTKVIDLPVNYLWVLPIINTLLVALQQFISNNSEKEV